MQTPSNAARGVSHVLVDLVQGLLADNGSQRPIAMNARLSDLGVTSIQMVSLMLSIESEFQVTIPPAEITPENFHSIDAISEMLGRIAFADHRAAG